MDSDFQEYLQKHHNADKSVYYGGYTGKKINERINDAADLFGRCAGKENCGAETENRGKYHSQKRYYYTCGYEIKYSEGRTAAVIDRHPTGPGKEIPDADLREKGQGFTENEVHHKCQGQV